MPYMRQAVFDDNSTTGHHGGGIMMKGGFDIEFVEVSVEQYASEVVKIASMDVAYRAWKANEIVMLNGHYFLSCDEHKHITFEGIGIKEKVEVTGNDNWRNDARAFIAHTCESEKMEGADVEDIGTAQTCAKFGDAL